MTTLTPVLLLAVALGLLALVLRWAFGDDRRAVPDHTGTDFGLLREVALVPTEEAAQVLLSRLHAAGLRATAVRRDGAHLLLVFPADVADAKLLLRKGP
ncbi:MULTISPECIES: hypothetical protein [Actinosynnema]|uniref:Uncharacterized protein n=2 Tax=Actinosynnema TaxID=40566 RepID=C6WHI7_ACTMD|nr:MULTISPECIES: hypothetical protein [Actinosynnema]ACU39936.1 hypothetical protein Amir_6129 [Actinosynnema mirum DSM 43827]ATE57028.1 hypothetical protein CNX65_30165 [Actinosynnema pretiosum]AXX33449.1 hypothetical protein APASM_6084 [Actinosynnema pretiosum subsp. pretiosum]